MTENVKSAPEQRVDLTPTEDDDDYGGEREGCSRCHGEGTIIVCIDDMCRGCGECMHGDGEIVCPDCKGGY